MGRLSEKSFRDVALTANKFNEFVQPNLGWHRPNGDQLVSDVIGQVCNFKN